MSRDTLADWLPELMKTRAAVLNDQIYEYLSPVNRPRLASLYQRLERVVAWKSATRMGERDPVAAAGGARGVKWTYDKMGSTEQWWRFANGDINDDSLHAIPIEGGRWRWLVYFGAVDGVQAEGVEDTFELACARAEAAYLLASRHER